MFGTLAGTDGRDALDVMPQATILGRTHKTTRKALRESKSAPGRHLELNHVIIWFAICYFLWWFCETEPSLTVYEIFASKYIRNTTLTFYIVCSLRDHERSRSWPQYVWAHYLENGWGYRLGYCYNGAPLENDVTWRWKDKIVCQIILDVNISKTVKRERERLSSNGVHQ